MAIFAKDHKKANASHISQPTSSSVGVAVGFPDEKAGTRLIKEVGSVALATAEAKQKPSPWTKNMFKVNTPPFRQEI